MANNGPPDLAAILSALQGSSQSPQTQPPSQTPQILQALQSGLQVPRDGQPSSGYGKQQSAYTNPPISQATRFPPPMNTSQQPQGALREPAKEPPIDPRTILTWSQALRHVTRLIARKPEASERVRKLIQSQKDHEAQWWDGRQKLLKQQSERGEGRKKIEEVLRSVGGHVDSSFQGPTPEEDAAEIARYDAKVHRALMEMEKSFMAELMALGIPFFGTRSELVVRDGDGNVGSNVSDTNEGGKPSKITEKELRELQKRIISLLVDLCDE